MSKNKNERKKAPTILLKIWDRVSNKKILVKKQKENALPLSIIFRLWSASHSSSQMWPDVCEGAKTGKGTHARKENLGTEWIF
jgi:hypothetical protein